MKTIYDKQVEKILADKDVEELVARVDDNKSLQDVAIKIEGICDSIKDLLLYKNALYGNSLHDGVGMFFKGSPADKIAIHLDEKIKRMMNNDDTPRLNDLCDLIGYLVHMIVACKYDFRDIQSFKD